MRSAMILWMVAGCAPDTCSDVDCMMRALELTIDGTAAPLTPVPAGAVPIDKLDAMVMGTIGMVIVPLSAPNGGDPVQMIQAGATAQSGASGSAPAITSQPPDVKFYSDTDEETFDVPWTDPYAMRPGFCLIPYDLDKQQAYQHCAYCTLSVRDGKTVGTAIIKGKAVKVVPASLDFGYGKTGPDACRSLNPNPKVGSLFAGNARGIGWTPPTSGGIIGGSTGGSTSTGGGSTGSTTGTTGGGSDCTLLGTYKGKLNYTWDDGPQSQGSGSVDLTFAADKESLCGGGLESIIISSATVSDPEFGALSTQTVSALNWHLAGPMFGDGIALNFANGSILLLGNANPSLIMLSADHKTFSSVGTGMTWMCTVPTGGCFGHSKLTYTDFSVTRQ